MCDNEGVVIAWQGRGSRDIHLARIFKELLIYCQDMNIHITLKWVCTAEQEADEPSRTITPIFSRLKTQYSNRLVNLLKIDIDLFASYQNRIGNIDFVSEYPHPKALAVDGMAFKDHKNRRCYAYPPRVLVLPFVRALAPKIQKLVMVRHVYQYEDFISPAFEREFQFKQLIGCKHQSACITPYDKKDSDIPYFRDYSEANYTFLYFKGFSLQELTTYVSTFDSQSDCSQCVHSRRRRLVRCQML